MQTPPLLMYDGWSGLIKSYSWISRLGSWCKMLESKYVSDRHIMLKLCREVYTFKSETFEILWAEILFKFEWHTERFSQEFDLDPGLSSMSSLQLIFTELFISILSSFKGHSNKKKIKLSWSNKCKKARLSKNSLKNHLHKSKCK